MKGRLQDAALAFPKTHDLVQLLHLIESLEPVLRPLQAALDTLSKAAVEIRYPGRSATKLDAKASLATARQVRTAIRSSLGLPP
jgi:HEPN domain-containing protein